jgi:uridine kinase
VTRIGVDGVTAAGKTTFADELAALLGGVARITLDDFHRPGQERYYPDSFDFAAFRAAVLAAGTPLVADGVFLFHPDLRDLWDLRIFLRCDRDVARERGIARDAGRMADARERYAARYVPGETRYLEEIDPESLADLVVDTTERIRAFND